MSDYISLYDIVGEINITLGFDAQIEKSNSYYTHLFGDANWQNNLVTKSVFLGKDLFKIVSFYPETISKYEPAGAPQREFPRMEQNLMYVELKSYLSLNHLNDARNIKVYFGDEELRIFNIKIGSGSWSYFVWIEKPKKRQRGRFRVDILGITQLSDKFLEISDKLGTVPSSNSNLYSPFYCYSIPLYFVGPPSGKDVPKPRYGLMPISIEDVNLREKALNINILVALKSRDYTWLEEGKGWSDVIKDNPSADLSKYVSSSSSHYRVYLFIRSRDKLLWHDKGVLISPKTLEANNREILKLEFDQVRAMLEKEIISGENEFLLVVTYTYTYEGDTFEIASDMYWSVFTVE